MIKLHYEGERLSTTTPSQWPLPQSPTIDMTITAESLDEVVGDIERFLRAVYGWIPVDEHLSFVDEGDTDC